jgi:hypothetical protein
MKRPIAENGSEFNLEHLKVIRRRCVEVGRSQVSNCLKFYICLVNIVFSGKFIH